MKTYETRLRVQLRCIPGKGGDRTLHGYLFRDSEHARIWLEQYPSVKDNYSLAIVSAYTTRIGEDKVRKVRGVLSVVSFLSQVGLPLAEMKFK